MATIPWPWAIVLCQFNDKPAVPQPSQYYIDLFTQNGMGGVCDYWRAVSCNALDLSSSQVFGWFTMNHSSTEVDDFKHQGRFPGARSILIQWGRDAAIANGVDLNHFRSVLIIQNYGHDHGAAGNGILVIHQNAALCEFGFICHEMGHGFQLPHSWSANPDTVYGDGWDLMSFATTTFQFNIRFQDTQGTATVGLNTRNVEALGAFPTGRLWQPVQPDFSTWVTLDPLNQPPLGNHGFLVAKLPPQSTRPSRGNNSTFTIEFRRKAGWDQGIPQDAVIIHEIRTDGNSYLQPGKEGQFVSGQQFVTPNPSVYIRVIGIDPIINTATVRIWDLPEGCLRKEDTHPEVYLIPNGQKRWVTSPEALFALGYTWEDVYLVPDGALSDLPDGPAIPHTLLINVSPYPVPLGQTVQVTITARDQVTNAAVAGNVWINEQQVGMTNVPFLYTFQVQRRRVFDPETRTWVWEMIAPQGMVKAGSYPDAPIDFGLPG